MHTNNWQSVFKQTPHSAPLDLERENESTIGCDWLVEERVLDAAEASHVKCNGIGLTSAEARHGAVGIGIGTSGGGR